MEPFATLFAQLIDREPAELTADQRASLEYYYASINLTEGVAADSPPRRWCDAATTVSRIAHMLGRLPRPGDPGATSEILDWIREQQRAPLNSYQRARLRAIPGGEALTNRTTTDQV